MYIIYIYIYNIYIYIYIYIYMYVFPNNHKYHKIFNKNSVKIVLLFEVHAF